jgi:Uma2 family endonuclease
MAGDTSRLVFSVEAFHRFRDGRPDHEKWELIDGVAVMMPPPRLMHQRISANLERMLNARLETSNPARRADREIGLLLPNDDRYNPEPDVTVIDAAIEADQLYAARFYFVAEGLSPNDKTAVLDSKLGYYLGHDCNQGVLFIHQDVVMAKLHSRTADGWRETKLVEVIGVLDIPGIGPIGRLGDLYRHTPLDPFA